ncbi:MAG: hypothetical protein J6Y14_00815 [Fibrobacter sp.]|nr:hypothetical protein [Fibrobacter sp.]
MSGALHIVDNMELNLNLDGSISELVSERNLYGFAHKKLAETIDEVLESVVADDDIVIDSLTLDLEVENSADVFQRIAEALRSALKSKITPAVFKAQYTPVTDMLADVYRHHLPMEKTCNIDSRFDEIAEAWNREHQDQKFNSLSLAETIIKRMREEFPNVDVQQIAYVVYQKIMQQKNAKKEQVAKRSRDESVANIATGLLEVADAGLVLLAPYLPALFERTGCIEKGAFVSDESKRKALSVLKYAAFGAYKEPLKNAAVMNLLCDLPASPLAYVDELPEVADSEKELVDGLLNAVIANWKAVGHMSPDGLRSTYLVRYGEIDTDGEADLLTVENKTYDILIDKLPWGYSMIKHPWMKKVLNVKWR